MKCIEPIGVFLTQIIIKPISIMTNSPDISTTTTTAAATANAAGQSAGGATNNNNINNFTNGSSISESLAGSSSNEGHRTPNVEHLSKTNLYIRGLQSNTVDQDLYNMCSRFGQISSTKAILDKSSGCCKGYGFVEFTSPQTAELALQELTKSGVQAQMAKITSLYSSNHHHHHHHQQHHHQQQHNHHHQHNQQQHQNQSQNSSSSNHSAVANITASSNGNGTTASSTSGNGNGNGTGVGNANGTGNSSGDGRGISSSASNSSNTQSHNQTPSHNNNADPTNLYIANLPPNMSEQELESLLSNYGPVVSTRILRDQSNIPRGVGFARMESRDKCEQIIEQLNGRPCKGWKEPLLVKFADGGNKKRHHHNNQHHNNNHHHHHHHHHQRHKAHQDDGRWRDASGTMDMGNVPSFDHQGNITHNEHLSDLSMMGTMGYQRMQHGFSPSVAHGAGYPTPLGPSTSGPQWIHSGAPGQAYVIPQQMIQNNALDPSNQAAAAAAAALHYGHIPQLASQMQGLQIAHPGGSVGGYLPPQHQWSALWTHPIPQQPHQQSMRLPAHMQPPPHPAPQQHRQQPSPHPTPVHQQQLTSPQPQPSLNDDKLQVSMPL